jgi:transcriptional regulator with GAF, ATPase, and Fis domain
MHCDIVGVWLPDVDHVYLCQLAMDFPESRGFAKENALQPIVGSVIGRVFKTGKPVLLDVISELLDPHEVTYVRAEALESGCALPLISRGRTLGVLTARMDIKRTTLVSRLKKLGIDPRRVS